MLNLVNFKIVVKPHKATVIFFSNNNHLTYQNVKGLLLSIRLFPLDQDHNHYYLYLLPLEVKQDYKSVLI